MAKTKIYAGHVENLTDARYFAAWYVDWMGFNLEKSIMGELPIQSFAAIKEWLDVKEFVAEFSGLEEEKEIKEILDYLEIGVIKLGPFAPFPLMKSLQNNTIFKEIIFENSTPLNSLKGIIEKEKEVVDYYIIKGQSNCQTYYLEEAFNDITFYFDLPNMASFIDKGILDSAICEGIVVKGGDEEKVGVKSFDELDTIYDLLIG